MDIRKRLTEILKKNKNIWYVASCVYYRNDKEFFDSVVDKNNYKNKFIVHKYGNKNKGKIIYNVKIIGGASGFFAIYRSILNALYVADEFGFTPYVEIMDSHYNDADENVFENFYEQPLGIYKEQVYESRGVIDYEDGHRLWAENEYLGTQLLVGGYVINEEYISAMAQIRKKYIHFKSEIHNKLFNDIGRLLTDCKSTIAIHFRGNAFKVGFFGHPIALTIEDYFEYMDDCIEVGYKYFFVATDDENALKILVDKYGNRILYYKDTFRSENGMDVHDQVIERKNNGYILAYEVIRDMLTMAECDGLIGGSSQVTIAARIEKFAKEEEYGVLKIIDKGLYQKDNYKAIDKYFKGKNIYRM